MDEIKPAGQADPQMWRRGADGVALCQWIANSGYEIVDLPGRVVDRGPRLALERQRN